MTKHSDKAMTTLTAMNTAANSIADLRAKPEDLQHFDRVNEVFGRRRAKKVHFAVKPRYSCGSPCYSVGERIARSVVDDEIFNRNAALDGIYGDEKKAEAEQLGLSGIVEARMEAPRGKGWDVLDLITGEKRFEPVKR